MSSPIIENRTIDHPHDLQNFKPDFLSKEEVRELSKISLSKIFSGIAFEYVVISLTILVCQTYWNPMLYILGVFLISARQQGLLVIGHDGAHLRIHRNRLINDLISDIFCSLPLFLTVRGVRMVHGSHHQFLDTEKDGNRIIFNTHNSAGQLVEEWIYPKTPMAYVKLVIWRGCGWSALYRIFRVQMQVFSIWKREGRGPRLFAVSCYAIAMATIFHFNLTKDFLMYWVVPRITWFWAAYYMRHAMDHSNLKGGTFPFDTARTIIPTWFDKTFIMPNNISYHLEHHFYPSIPFYNLPLAHRLMMRNKSVAENACICRGARQALKQLLVSSTGASQSDSSEEGLQSTEAA